MSRENEKLRARAESARVEVKEMTHRVAQLDRDLQGARDEAAATLQGDFEQVWCSALRRRLLWGRK